MDYPFDLERFITAQAPVYAAATAELRAGHKTTHWMWFVFPQLRALGRSSTALHYGIASRAEAVAYARHPVLGARLRECCELVLAIEERTAHDIFGSPDDLKLRSSMTLFAAVAPEAEVFGRVLARYYGGETDQRTVELL
ncbi:MAG: DUF1810 domain-containing protein [Methylibium sp.]|nr:DUF1810 domain-containing protein [Methylibium sp.]